MNLSSVRLGSHRNSFVSILISIFVIAVLVVAGPADAVLLHIKDLPDTAYRGTVVSFIFDIDLGPMERIPIDEIVINITNPDASITNCSFYPNGTLKEESFEIFKCRALELKNTHMINMTEGERWGFDPSGSSWQHYGYGYGFGYGYGYGDSTELSYNVTWNTLKYGHYNIHILQGNYTIKMSVIPDGSYAYHSDTKAIELLKYPGEKDICNPVSGPDTCTGRFTSTRVLPPSCIIDSEINVTVNIDVNESNKPKILILKEYIPPGFAVSDYNGGNFDAEKRILRWFIVESAYHGTTIEDMAFTYRLIPETQDTEYLFGTVEDAKEMYRTEGDNTLQCTINASLLNDTDGDEWPDYLDCEPLNPDVYPGAPEICNGIDDDCDGQVDEGVTNTCMNYSTCTTYETCAACPAEPAEICMNGIDDNCNGEIDEGCPPLPEEPVYGSFTVTRDMADNVSSGTEFNVTLTVNINESDVPGYYVIKEYVPQGMTLTDRDYAYYDPDSRMLRWFVVESDYLGTHVVDTTYTYTVSSDTAATYNFSGQVKYREVHFEIGGKNQTDVY